MRPRCQPGNLLSRLARWKDRASTGGHVPSFVRTLAEAAFRGCVGDYALLRPALLELKRRYPEGAA